MLQKQNVTKKFEDIKDVKALLKASFPPSEQAPMGFLISQAKRDYIEFNAYYDGDLLSGFAYLIIDEDIVFVLYLAVEGSHRSKGYGSQILKHIRDEHPDKRIVLGVEAEDESAQNNDQRKRRKEFYLRNGYSSTGLIFVMRGVDFEILSCNGGCTAADVLHMNKKFLGAIVFTFFKPKLKKDASL